MSPSCFPNTVVTARMLTCQLAVLASLTTPALAQTGYAAISVKTTVAQADAQAEHTFTLTNDTTVDMSGFYASPQTATDWEENILGNDAIRANGDWTLITLPSSRGCIYDFLAVFDDGDKLERYGINVCELETHTYYEN